MNYLNTCLESMEAYGRISQPAASRGRRGGRVSFCPIGSASKRQGLYTQGRRGSARGRSTAGRSSNQQPAEVAESQTSARRGRGRGRAGRGRGAGSGRMMTSTDVSMDSGAGSTSQPLVSQFDVLGLQSGSSNPSMAQTSQQARQPLAEIAEDAEVSSPVQRPKRKERSMFFSVAFRSTDR